LTNGVFTFIALLDGNKELRFFPAFCDSKTLEGVKVDASDVCVANALLNAVVYLAKVSKNSKFFKGTIEVCFIRLNYCILLNLKNAKNVNHVF